MPWDDEKLADAVRDACDREHQAAPGFGLMWEEASSAARRPARFLEAAAAIVVSVGLVGLLYGGGEESQVVVAPNVNVPAVVAEVEDAEEGELDDEWTFASWEVPTDVLLTEEPMDDSWGDEFYDDRIDELMEL
jgi:hypothetical protein